MVVADVIKLIPEQVKGMFEASTATPRTVFCDVASVSQKEFYTATAQGLQPEYRFILADHAEWQGERMCEFHNEKYHIIRTYRNGDAIELTAERVNADA